MTVIEYNLIDRFSGDITDTWDAPFLYDFSVIATLVGGIDIAVIESDGVGRLQFIYSNYSGPIPVEDVIKWHVPDSYLIENGLSNLKEGL